MENGVGFVERNFLVPVPQVASLEEFNALLLDKCLAYARELKVPGTQKTVAEVREEEKKALLPQPAKPFACSREIEVKSDRYSRVCFETNRYSEPVTNAGSFLTLRAYVDRIEVWQDGQYAWPATRGATAAVKRFSTPCTTCRNWPKSRGPGRTPGP